MINTFSGSKLVRRSASYISNKSPSCSITRLVVKSYAVAGATTLTLRSSTCVSSVFFIKFNVFLKSFIRNPERSLRSFWLTPGAPSSLTTNSKGSRMGNGKGKKLHRVLFFYSYQPLLAVSNMRFGKVSYTCNYIGLRFAVNCYVTSNIAPHSVYSQSRLTVGFDRVHMVQSPRSGLISFQ